MPAFFGAEFWNFANPQLWVGVGLLIFLGIAWKMGALKQISAMLDAKSAAVKSNLDEAERLRVEAEALLAELRAKRVAAEALAAEILTNAKAEAKRLEAEAKVELEATIARREVMAERRIALAETQAAAEVKAAAADLAAQATEVVLADRLRSTKHDPLIDGAISGLAGKFT